MGRALHAGRVTPGGAVGGVLATGAEAWSFVTACDRTPLEGSAPGSTAGTPPPSKVGDVKSSPATLSAKSDACRRMSSASPSKTWA